MTKEETINDLFEKEETIELETQIWGKNPRRSQALKDLWFKLMSESIDEENKPEPAKRELLFLMTANNVMDMIMESVPDELALEISYCFDSLIGLSMVNSRFEVDLVESNYEVLEKIKREEHASDEAYEATVKDVDERWWTVGKQHLGGRSPNDAIAEELSKYGLNK